MKATSWLSLQLQLLISGLVTVSSDSGGFDMVVDYKPKACWLYPISQTDLGMACATDLGEVPSSPAVRYVRCWPVTQEHLKSKGFQNFPASAFTGSRNRGVICPVDIAHGNVDEFKQSETIDPKCNGSKVDGLPTYHWFNAFGKGWWYGCNFS